MPDLYLIGDTIRFTAKIKNLDGAEYKPDIVTISIFSEDGTELLDSKPALEDEELGSYHYDWKVTGITDRSNLIVVWDWSGAHKKRKKFKVILETD